MTQLTLSIPQVGLSDQTEDPKVANNFTSIQAWANGNVDGTNLSAAAALSAGMNQVGQAVKGTSTIATSQSTSSTTYTTLGTPDQVTGIVLPTNGVMAVLFQAQWAESTGSSARAAIFLGANQLKVQSNVGGTPGPNVQAAATNNTSTLIFMPLFSHPTGLASVGNTTAGYASDVTTGQAVGNTGTAQGYQEIANSGIYQGFFTAGGPCYIKAAAGTYTVSVQFKSNAGTSISVVNRTLSVWVISPT